MAANVRVLRDRIERPNHADAPLGSDGKREGSGESPVIRLGREIQHQRTHHPPRSSFDKITTMKPIPPPDERLMTDEDTATISRSTQPSILPGLNADCISLEVARAIRLLQSLRSTATSVEMVALHQALVPTTADEQLYCPSAKSQIRRCSCSRRSMELQLPAPVLQRHSSLNRAPLSRIHPALRRQTTLINADTPISFKESTGDQHVQSRSDSNKAEMDLLLSNAIEVSRTLLHRLVETTKERPGDKSGGANAEKGHDVLEAVQMTQPAVVPKKTKEYVEVKEAAKMVDGKGTLQVDFTRNESHTESNRVLEVDKKEINNPRRHVSRMGGNLVKNVPHISKGHATEYAALSPYDSATTSWTPSLAGSGIRATERNLVPQTHTIPTSLPVASAKSNKSTNDPDPAVEPQMVASRERAAPDAIPVQTKIRGQPSRHSSLKTASQDYLIRAFEPNKNAVDSLNTWLRSTKSVPSSIALGSRNAQRLPRPDDIPWRSEGRKDMQGIGKDRRKSPRPTINSKPAVKPFAPISRDSTRVRNKLRKERPNPIRKGLATATSALPMASDPTAEPFAEGANKLQESRAEEGSEKCIQSEQLAIEHIKSASESPELVDGYASRALHAEAAERAPTVPTMEQVPSLAAGSDGKQKQCQTQSDGFSHLPSQSSRFRRRSFLGSVLGRESVEQDSDLKKGNFRSKRPLSGPRPMTFSRLRNARNVDTGVQTIPLMLTQRSSPQTSDAKDKVIQGMDEAAASEFARRKSRDIAAHSFPFTIDRPRIVTPRILRLVKAIDAGTCDTKYRLVEPCGEDGELGQKIQDADSPPPIPQLPAELIRKVSKTDGRSSTGGTKHYRLSRAPSSNSGQARPPRRLIATSERTNSVFFATPHLEKLIDPLVDLLSPVRADSPLGLTSAQWNRDVKTWRENRRSMTSNRASYVSMGEHSASTPDSPKDAVKSPEQD